MADRADYEGDIPQRRFQNGWKKFHAERDCGAQTVWYIENAWMHADPWTLYCCRCTSAVHEDEVLFVNDSWFNEFNEEHGYRGSFEDFTLSEDRVLELGPDPDGEGLIEGIADQQEECNDRRDEHRERLKEAGVPHLQEEGD
ncbi:hypothetical protein [Halorarum salinum]|uniref:Uncharacterized protein n=1 Tax=Halorarum salinum TaxID=2743089 RepID=A0A7D5QD69_9EURY|nr:hypothetical protein [Halobaculum salinum]QLG63060.1 hypothetical protein HUG12_15500 [Halobaculum salinum]